MENIDELKNEFSNIYDKYVVKIYRFVFLKVSYQEIAEDITSETFLRGWKAFQGNAFAEPTQNKTRNRRGNKIKRRQEIKNISAFLYQIARNLVTDFYRQKGKTKIVSTDVTIMPNPAWHSNPLDQVDLEIEMGQVQKALSQIKEDYQDVIIWHYLDELSISEIAEILDKPEGTVRVRLHRALNALRKTMNNEQ